ncbi:type II toxin-antitoxin system VapC family toxin [Halorhabdus amylolytica]|uniref:type II toxin-antitoxin system VapC family toxin n=1 Tax=Halorhabdus amylolytica TaxID=2559573 RepID=UPI0010AA77DB|nr:PIN domain-containing protein [Halorhabdus amylolytica]
MRLVPDVNALAIQLIEDHPGHRYVAEQLVPALQGEHTLVSFGYLPLRVQWVLEDLDFSTVEARNAVSSLLEYPLESVVVETRTVQRAYEISAEKNHDVYDCFYIAIAREANADRIVTTDRDFEALCEDESFEYTNPVPEDVLKKFHRF